jgi:hypothetical protein
MAEAIIGVQLLGVEVSGTQMRIANRSERTLTDCRFGGGFSVTDVGRLDPGMSVSAEQVSEVAGPAFTCSLPELPVPLVERIRRITTTGTTVVAVYRPDVPAAGQAGLDK